MARAARVFGRWGGLAGWFAFVAGCASVTPQAVSPDIAEPVFEPGAVLRGPFALGPALCSLATVGLDLTLLPAEPRLPEGVPLLSEVCSGTPEPDSPLSTGPRGMWARLEGAEAWAEDPQRLEARQTGVLAVVYRVPRPRGVAIVFTGLAMPADSDALRRFSVALARRHWTSAVVVRDDSIGGLDPRWEAHRGLALAAALRRSCAGEGPPPPVAFLGISMGGLEALLAARDSGVRPALGEPRAVVLDPVLDIREVAAHLDSAFHRLSTDAMQAYFQRIMAGRYRRGAVRFACELDRRPPTGRMSDPDADAPAAWLCDGPVRRYSIFLSATDPVLGDEQRRRLEDRAFSFERTSAGGHVPLACDLALYDRMADAAADTSGATFSVCAGPTEPRPPRPPDPSCGAQSESPGPAP